MPIRSALWIIAGTLAGSLMVPFAAVAGVCDARFMHDGGFVQFTGQGNLQLGADLDFSDVAKQDGGNCRARVRGTARFSYAGLPPGKPKLDYLMTVRAGHASFVRYGAAGEKPGNPGQFDLRMLGLFAYESGIRGAGQRLPGAAYQLKIGKDAPVGGSPTTTVRIGEKTVGKQQAIDTVLGRLSCWPISYARNSDPTTANFRGLAIPIPGLQTQVTDWYCPAVNLVMKQDIRQGADTSSVAVTQIR